jgi:hypothetical protein
VLRHNQVKASQGFASETRNCALITAPNGCSFAGDDDKGSKPNWAQETAPCALAYVIPGSQPPGAEQDRQERQRRADLEISPEPNDDAARLSALRDDQIGSRSDQSEIAGKG